MDFSNCFTFVLKFMPLISSTGHTDLKQWDGTLAVKVVREIVLIVHSDTQLRSSVFNFESGFLIPSRFLATIVDCLGLEFLLVELKNSEWILIAE